ncbi:hypothetical protein SODALDRAFT_335721 [Sodiomyces alkalinus F11]|uniref:Uncharacterized protein n=1 Tax=Sodiomyces alkalinus (strain CBS 110278 / VKM F-3762 / F11) TaxID=1314773 RepID=A0A3N2PQ31_SODAK|nr:hypothetical protein SODALDRAFT_335721 [Sodiomyces alkalinus F11]ROT36621.1 hypothetical protein SODALDRAFT_335721 [Sodiomyces alkalinus F11]
MPFAALKASRHKNSTYPSRDLVGPPNAMRIVIVSVCMFCSVLRANGCHWANRVLQTRVCKAKTRYDDSLDFKSAIHNHL